MLDEGLSEPGVCGIWSALFSFPYCSLLTLTSHTSHTYYAMKVGLGALGSSLVQRLVSRLSSPPPQVIHALVIPPSLLPLISFAQRTG